MSALFYMRVIRGVTTRISLEDGEDPMYLGSVISRVLIIGCGLYLGGCAEDPPVHIERRECRAVIVQKSQIIIKATHLREFVLECKDYHAEKFVEVNEEVWNRYEEGAVFPAVITYTENLSTHEIDTELTVKIQ